jgi:hypothetical protein
MEDALLCAWEPPHPVVVQGVEGTEPYLEELQQILNPGSLADIPSLISMAQMGDGYTVRLEIQGETEISILVDSHSVLCVTCGNEVCAVSILRYFKDEALIRKPACSVVCAPGRYPLHLWASPGRAYVL